MTKWPSFIFLFQVFWLMVTLISVYVIYSSLQNIKWHQAPEKTSEPQEKSDVLKLKGELSELEKIEKASLSNLTENEVDIHINDHVLTVIDEIQSRDGLSNETESHRKLFEKGEDDTKENHIHQTRQLKNEPVKTEVFYKEKDNKMSNNIPQQFHGEDKDNVNRAGVKEQRESYDTEITPVNNTLEHDNEDEEENDIPDLVIDSAGMRRFDNNDQAFSLKESKNLSGVYRIFKTFPNYQNETKILAYRCLSKCGGWADRLKGIMQVYMLSLLSRRRFAIVMTEPSDLQHFLKPSLLDWRLNESEIVNLSKGELDNKKLHDATAAQYEQQDYDPATLFNQDLVYVIANQDWTRSLRKLTVIQERFPAIYKYSASDLMRIIYHGLFTPMDKLQSIVDSFFENSVNGKKLACLHARMGEEIYLRYNFDEIMTPLNFLKTHYSSKNYKILVASDNLEVKNFSRSFFPNFVDTAFAGPIMHIDYMKNVTDGDDVKKSAFMRSLVDHMVLSRCDTLVLTASGFGITSAMIRHTSRDLFVYIKEKDTRKVIPVRRETVREMFQYNCLAQISSSTYVCDA